MMPNRDSHLVSGILAGIVGGLAASWVMNKFMEDVGPKVQEAFQSAEGVEQPERQPGNEPPQDDATMKAADAIVSTVTGGRHLSHEGRRKGGPVVHYAFGAIMGGLYGALAECVPSTTAGFGTSFGSALFVGADLIAVPALNLSGPSKDAPASSLASPYGAHVVYGFTTEAVRRLVRAML